LTDVGDYARQLEEPPARLLAHRPRATVPARCPAAGQLHDCSRGAPYCSLVVVSGLSFAAASWLSLIACSFFLSPPPPPPPPHVRLADPTPRRHFVCARASSSTAIAAFHVRYVGRTSDPQLGGSYEDRVYSCCLPVANEACIYFRSARAVPVLAGVEPSWDDAAWTL